MYGIDLGTSYVRMAEVSRRRAQPVAITWDDDEDDTEKLVRIEGKEIHVGDNISCPLFSENNMVAFGPMCLIGREYDESVEIASKYWNFPVANVEGKPLIVCKKGMETVQIQPEMILSEILAKFKSLARKRRPKKENKEEPEDKFVISVPGCYNYAQRRAVLFAAAQAEMEVEYIINNTTAIALSQLIKRELRKCVIIDVGAESFTISAISLEEDKLKVLSTVGENHWGGSDLNNKMITYCIEYFAKSDDRIVTPEELEGLVRSCELAKHKLDNSKATSIKLPVGSCKITKGMFDKWNSELVKMVSRLMERCFIEAKLVNETDFRVILVGGTCQLREMDKVISEQIRVNKGCVIENLSADRQLVANGAAQMAGYRSGEYSRLVREVEEVTPLLGVMNPVGRVCEVIPLRTSLNTASPLTLSTSFNIGTKRACTFYVQVYEKERTSMGWYVYIGGTSVSLPDSQGGENYYITATFKIENTSFLVTVTEPTTKTSVDIAVSREEGLPKYLGPIVKELLPYECELPSESDNDERERDSSSDDELQEFSSSELEENGTRANSRELVQNICDSCNAPIDSSEVGTQNPSDSDSRLCKECANLLAQNIASGTESLPNTDTITSAGIASDNVSGGLERSEASCQTEDGIPSHETDEMIWTSEPGDIVPFSNTNETPWPYKGAGTKESSDQTVTKQKSSSVNKKVHVHPRINIPCCLHEDHVQYRTHPKLVMEAEDYVFGIDLGTTSIQLAYVKGSKIEFVRDYPTNPYCGENLVRFQEGIMMIGDSYESEIFERNNAIPCEVLRLVGRRYNNYVREISRFWSYPVVKVKGWPHMTFKNDGEDVTISPEMVLSEILKEIKLFVKKNFCKKKDPVFAITVPAACTYVHRRAVKKAARMAGLRVPYLINDTTALMLLKRSELFTGTCVIIDLGGGSLTISAFRVTQRKIIELSTVGDSNWGGDDLDNSIIAHCLEIFKQNEGTDMSSSDLETLRRNCVKAKYELTTKRETKIDIPGCHEPCSMTREDFEEWNSKRFTQLTELLNRCLWEAHIDPKIERTEKVQVILHGTSTQVPKVREIVLNCFAAHVNVKTSYRLRGTEARKPQTTADIQEDMRKRGKIAKGAAIRAAMDTGIAESIEYWPKNLEVFELAPALGLRTAFGNFTEIIPRSYIPMCKYKSYVVDTKNEGDVRIHVFEQERAYERKHVCIGGVSLKFPPACGVVYLIVTFCVGRNDFVVTVADSMWKQERIVVMSDKFGDPELTDSAGRILLHPREPMSFIGWIGRSVSTGPENEVRSLKEDDKISSAEWSLINVKLCFCSPYKTSRFEIVRNVASASRNISTSKNRVAYARDHYGNIQTVTTNVGSMISSSIPTVVIGISPEFLKNSFPDVTREMQSVYITGKNQVHEVGPREAETQASSGDKTSMPGSSVSTAMIGETQKSATANASGTTSENQSISLNAEGQKSLMGIGDFPLAKEADGTSTNVSAATIAGKVESSNDNVPNVIKNIRSVSITEEQSLSASGEKQESATNNVSNARTSENQSIPLNGVIKPSIPCKGVSPFTKETEVTSTSTGGKQDCSDANVPSIIREVRKVCITEGGQASTPGSGVSATTTGEKQKYASVIQSTPVKRQSERSLLRNRASCSTKETEVTRNSGTVASIKEKQDCSNGKIPVVRSLRQVSTIEEKQEPLYVLRDTKNIHISKGNQATDTTEEKQESATDNVSDETSDIIKSLPGKGTSPSVNENEVVSKSKKRRSRKRKSMQAKTSECTEDATATDENPGPLDSKTGKRKGNKKHK